MYLPVKLLLVKHTSIPLNFLTNFTDLLHWCMHDVVVCEGVQFVGPKFERKVKEELLCISCKIVS